MNEEDTVTVGQDLLRLEPGTGGDASAKSTAESGGAETKPTSTPEEPNSAKQVEDKPQGEQPQQQASESSLSKEQERSSPQASPKNSPISQGNRAAETAASSPGLPGTREERRVCANTLSRLPELRLTRHSGENEPYEATNRRTVEAVAEHCGIPNNVQRGRHERPDGFPKVIQG